MKPSDSYGTRVTVTELKAVAELEAVGGTLCRGGRVSYVSMDTLMYLIGPARQVASSQSVCHSTIH